MWSWTITTPRLRLRCLKRLSHKMVPRRLKPWRNSLKTGLPKGCRLMENWRSQLMRWRLNIAAHRRARVWSKPQSGPFRWRVSRAQHLTAYSTRWRMGQSLRKRRGSCGPKLIWAARNIPMMLISCDTCSCSRSKRIWCPGSSERHAAWWLDACWKTDCWIRPFCRCHLTLPHGRKRTA